MDSSDQDRGLQFFKRDVSGIEDRREAVWGGTLEVTQLKHGPIKGHILHTLLGEASFTIGQMDEAVPLRIRGPIPEGYLCLGTRLSLSAPASYWGFKASPGDVAVFSAGSEQDSYIGGQITYAVLTVPVESAINVIHVLAPEVVPFLGRPAIRSSSSLVRRLTVASLGLSIATLRRLHANPRANFNTQSFFLTLLAPFVTALSIGAVDRPRQYAQDDLQLVRFAEDVLRGGNASIVSVIELCLALGVSRRTLERAFRRSLDMSPVHYLMLFRLSRAREDLLRTEETVSSVATKYGFYELGRFAGRYKQLFGELPSETYARRRGTVSSPALKDAPLLVKRLLRDT